jgi:hypothetical protein
MRCRVFTLLLSCISPFAFSLTVENLRTDNIAESIVFTQTAFDELKAP